MKTYTHKFQVRDTTVTIETTEKDKFYAIDKFVMHLYCHYRDEKPEDLDKLMNIINSAYENLLDKQQFEKRYEIFKSKYGIQD